VTHDLDDLAARCAVAIYCHEDFLGSGFLIAPGRVLTCAHVVAFCEPGMLTIRWPGGELGERCRLLIPPSHGPGPTYASPDLALITVDSVPEQPFVWLADYVPSAASTVACFGYSQSTPAAGPAPDSVILQVAGGGGDGLVRVQQGEIPAGMSGSLARDLRTQRVCGMIKASRDPQAARGGWLVPIPAIADHLGDTFQRNLAGHGPESPWRQLATRRSEFTEQLFRSQALLRVPDPRHKAPPSWWLNPRHRATRFQHRPELETLLAWALNEDPATPVAKLIVGEGGAGKTRLAVELAEQLNAHGWIAGLLTADDAGRLQGIAETLPEIARLGHQVFIAIDYPEGLARQLTAFLSLIPRPDQGTVRVLLLARFAGWWKAVSPSGEISYLIDREPINLPPLANSSDASVDRFAEAVDDYRRQIVSADTGTGTGTVLPAGLMEVAQKHTTAIKIHALALVSILHERDHGVLPVQEVGWADPLTLLVDHERKHWREAASHLACSVDHRLEGRILLVPTLLPVYKVGEAQAAISRVPGLDERFPGAAPQAADLLRDLYPPDEASSLRWWSPLPLDRLGETLLAEVFAGQDGQTACDYAAALLSEAPIAQAIQGFTVMARLNTDPQLHPDTAERLGTCLDTLATTDGFRLLPALLLADRQVPSGQRPGARILANLNYTEALALAQDLERGSNHRLLQEIGLVLLDHAARILNSDEHRMAISPEPLRDIFSELRKRDIIIPAETIAHVHADALRALLLVRLGRAGEATIPAERAARIVRAMFRASSVGGPGPKVIMNEESVVHVYEQTDISESYFYALDVYAGTLNVVGRLEESVQVRRECAAVAARIAESAPPEGKRAAVVQLYKLADALLAIRRTDEAEAWARAAVQHARTLPMSLLSAEVLTLWARIMDALGKTANARVVARDALRLHHEVSEETGVRVHLAAAEQALESLMPDRPGHADPLGELRETAQRDPVRALPEFINGSLRRSERLVMEGQTEEARLLCAEAITQARRLAAEDPDTYLLRLAYVLLQCVQLGGIPDALATSAEGVGIIRRLVTRHGRRELAADLALFLMSHSLLLRDQGRDAEAIPGFAEAIELLRPVLYEDRWRTAAYLTTALQLFAETSRKHGDYEQAVAAAREAIDLEVARTDDLTPTPASHLVQLKHVLFSSLAGLTGIRAGQGADLDSLLAIGMEICELAREFPADELDAAGVGIFAGTLGMAGIILRDSGHAQDAFHLLDEALIVLRSYADSHPDEADVKLLLMDGLTHVSVCIMLARHDQTARAITGLLADCRRPLNGAEEQVRQSLQMAMKVMDEFPRPVFLAETMQVVAEFSRTCRQLPPDVADSRSGVAASALVIPDLLREAVRNSLAGEALTEAVLEVSSGVQFLQRHQPSLLKADHARALSFGSALLAGNDIDQALQLNKEALDLYQSLAASTAGPPVGPDTRCLVLQGVLLSAKSRHEDAIESLEQALPLLLAAGEDITDEQMQSLYMTTSLLMEAYKKLDRGASIEAMMATVRTAGVPLTFTVPSQPLRKPEGDLLNRLQAAEQLAEADPEQGSRALEEALAEAAAREDYITARAACQRIATVLVRTARFAEALRFAELQVGYAKKARLGPWTQLYDRYLCLKIRSDAGLHDEAIVGETVRLLAEADAFPKEPEHPEAVPSWWVRESLLRAASRVCLRMARWADALRYVQSESASLRDRDSEQFDIADAEFGAYAALINMGRIAEARELLNRCEGAFQQPHDGQDRHLGLLAGARANIAIITNNLAEAIQLQATALQLLYRSGDVRQIQTAHTNFAAVLKRSDEFSADSLAHHLAAAVVGDLLGSPIDIQAVASGMFLRAGDYPASSAQLCVITGEVPGVYLAALLEKLCRNRQTTPDQALRRVLRQAHDSQRAMFQELARHCTEWDPVFSGIAAARAGDIAAARAVQQRLPVYVINPSWSQFCRALAYILDQADEVTLTGIELDKIDQILLRRCMETLQGSLQLPRELVEAIPISGQLSQFLGAAQAGEPSSDLARSIEKLAEQPQWHSLRSPLQKILAGDRDPTMTSGLNSTHKVIISALLDHLRIL
jgi:tetratricopeptide (TPR) repeat protein